MHTPNQFLCMTLHSFHIGGCEFQLLNLSKSLRNKGIDLIILHSHAKGSISYPSTEQLKFFPIPYFFFKFRLIPLYLSWFFRWKLKRIPTLFHCHAISGFTEQILWFAHKKNIPAILKVTTEGHVSTLQKQIKARPTLFGLIKELWRKNSFLEKRSLLERVLFGKRRFETYSKVAAYLSINPSISIELANFPIETKKIISLHNAVDPERFSPVEAEKKAALKRELGLPEGMHFITMVARFVERKRIKDLITAWAKIEHRFPQHLLLLVGDGPDKSSCEYLVSELKIQTRVIFTGFRLEIEKFFQITDLFAFSSQLEGLPNVLLEAMSCQLPIVASAIAGIKEIINPSEHGLLFPPRDTHALKEALLYMLKHPKEANRMALSARKKILNLYSFEKITPQFIAVYQQVVKA